MPNLLVSCPPPRTPSDPPVPPQTPLCPCRSLCCPFLFSMTSHLHVQHSVEYGLSETFPHMSLLISVYDLIPELLLWHDTPTPADLLHTHTHHTQAHTQISVSGRTCWVFTFHHFTDWCFNTVMMFMLSDDILSNDNSTVMMFFPQWHVDVAVWWRTSPTLCRCLRIRTLLKYVVKCLSVRLLYAPISLVTKHTHTVYI